MATATTVRVTWCSPRAGACGRASVSPSAASRPFYNRQVLRCSAPKLTVRDVRGDRRGEFLSRQSPGHGCQGVTSTVTCDNRCPKSRCGKSGHRSCNSDGIPRCCSASADLVGIDLRKTAAVFVLGTLALTGCSSGGGKSDKLPDTVNLGVLVTLSGSDPAQNTEGQARLQGAQLAAELLNNPTDQIKLPAQLGKTKIRVTSQDTHGSSDGGADAANRLTAAAGGNRIAGIISADSADVTAVAAPHAQVAGIPLVTAIATDGFLTQLSQTI